MTKLTKHLKYISGGLAATLALSSVAYAGPVKDLSQRVNCDSCCCDQVDLEIKKPASIFQGGLDDNYQNGNSEEPNPRPDLKTIPQVVNYAVTHSRASTDVTRDYDELHFNEFFLETIKVPNASTMKNGWLVFHLKANGSNDGMQFGNVVDFYTEVNDALSVPRPRDDIHARVFTSNVNSFLTTTDSLGPVFKLDSGTGAYYARLDRVVLRSAAHSGTTNLLEQIKSDGFMDVLIQDDTGVDYIAIIACIDGEDKPRIRPKKLKRNRQNR